MVVAGLGGVPQPTPPQVDQSRFSVFVYPYLCELLVVVCVVQVLDVGFGLDLQAVRSSRAQGIGLARWEGWVGASGRIRMCVCVRARASARMIKLHADYESSLPRIKLVVRHADKNTSITFAPTKTTPNT